MNAAMVLAVLSVAVAPAPDRAAPKLIDPATDAATDTSVIVPVEPARILHIARRRDLGLVVGLVLLANKRLDGIGDGVSGDRDGDGAGDADGADADGHGGTDRDGIDQGPSVAVIITVPPAMTWLAFWIYAAMSL